MCERRPDRDARGRLLPGNTANPAGRPVRTPYLRLLEAAEDAGATVLVLLPPRPARAAIPGGDDLPPEAA